MSTGILIVTFNNEKDISSCIQSLQAQTVKDFEILIWDNASQDNTLANIPRHSNTKIFSGKVNLGFAEACNKGASRLIRNGHIHILLLNPDTVAAPDMLEMLLKGMAARKASIVQPTIYIGGTNNTINTNGNALHFSGLSYCTHFNRQLEAQNLEIAVASGACFLVESKVINNIGLFRSQFFTYQEDTDFCWHAHMAGYKLAVIGDASLWHRYQFKLNPQKIFHLEKNRMMMLICNYCLYTTILLLPALLFLEVHLFLYFSLKGGFISKIKAYLYILTHMLPILKQRRDIQRRRAVPDSDILSLMTYKLEFEGIRSSILKRFTTPVSGAWFKAILKLYGLF